MSVDEIITGIWREILALERLEPEVDFFEMGGDSLMALNMLFRVGKELGIELPPVLLFERPVLKDFISSVEELNLHALSAAGRARQ